MDLIAKEIKTKFVYPNKEIWGVKDISTIIPAGKVTGIVGESGSGKSVFVMSVLKLLPSNGVISGQCFYGENDLLKMKEKELERIRSRNLVFIPQQPQESLNPAFKIKKQFKLAMKYGRMDRSWDKVEMVLRSLGFENPKKILESYSFQLSGGMCQRVLIALALIREPQWLIADEPTKGLDKENQKDVTKLFKSIVKDNRSTMLITHDLLFAKELCDNNLILYDGKILEEGLNVLDKPIHPYTISLFESLPNNGLKEVVKLRDKTENSCSFYEKCPSAMEKCGTGQPDLKQIDPSRKVRCFLYD